MATKISISELKVIGGTIVLFFSFKVISPFTVLLPLTHDFWKMVESNSLVNQYGKTSRILCDIYHQGTTWGNRVYVLTLC